LNHIVEPSGRMVPALDFSAPVVVSPLARSLDGLQIGVSACGQPTVSRIHPVDGRPESFGIFATPALAEHFLKTFGGAQCGHVTTEGRPE
jgi:hypothetical protein